MICKEQKEEDERIHNEKEEKQRHSRMLTTFHPEWDPKNVRKDNLNYDPYDFKDKPKSVPTPKK